MKNLILKVVSDGRITIPAPIRKKLEIQDGDHIEIQIVRKINSTGD